MKKFVSFCLFFLFVAELFAQPVISEINPLLPSGEYLMSDEFAKRSLAKYQLSSLVTDTFFPEILQVVVLDPELFDGLELLEHQRKTIQSAIVDYEKVLDETNRDLASQELKNDVRKLMLREKLGPAQSKLRQQILGVLLPEQIVQLVQGKSEQIGFSKRIINSHLGNWLGVSDKQKRKIVDEQKKLHDEMIADLAKYRQRSLDIVIDNLSREQKEKFLDQFKDEKLRIFYSRLQFNDVLNQTKPESDELSFLQKGNEDLKGIKQQNSSSMEFFLEYSAPASAIKINGK